MQSIKAEFSQRFYAKPRMFVAPGRINLIGEHTDYNDGFVLPASINKQLHFALAPNGDQALCRIYAFDKKEYYEFNLSTLKPLEGGWQNYVMGVADELLQKGSKLKGFDLVFGGNIPQGAGLSSSAALECGLAYGLNQIYELGYSKKEIAMLAQKAEHTYAGVQCGIMDQFSSIFGKKDTAIQLDCRSLKYRYIPLKLNAYTFVLCNTGVAHSLGDTAYNERREQCQEGVAVLQKKYSQVKMLRDVTTEMLEKHKDEFAPIVFMRSKYVVGENHRVQAACQALEQGDLVLLGKLIYSTHKGLSQEYQVSCNELDFLVKKTQNDENVLGARMIGGGFGGCTLNIVHKKHIDTFVAYMKKAYQKEYNIDLETYSVEITDGVREIE